MLNCLLCICLSAALGAGALGVALLLLAAFFSDRFYDLLIPKTKIRNLLKSDSVAKEPEKTN